MCKGGWGKTGAEDYSIGPRICSQTRARAYWHSRNPPLRPYLSFWPRRRKWPNIALTSFTWLVDKLISLRRLLRECVGDFSMPLSEKLGVRHSDSESAKLGIRMSDSQSIWKTRSPQVGLPISEKLGAVSRSPKVGLPIWGKLGVRKSYDSWINVCLVTKLSLIQTLRPSYHDA